MNKKMLSLALALAMCASLAAPAFAEDGAPMTTEEGVKNISVTADIGELAFNDLVVEKAWTLRDWDYNEETDEMIPLDETKDAYIAVTRNTKFTVTHTGTEDDGTVLYIYLTDFVNSNGDVYDWDEWPHESYLTNKDGFIPDIADPDGEAGGLVELKAGESVTFTVPFSWYDGTDSDVIFKLQAIMYFPQYDWNFWKYYYLKEDDASYNAAVAKGPSATEPEPTTPPADTIPASGTAVASTQTVTVDGKAVEFQMYALKDSEGNGTNYIKLRDMAYILNGTKAQFSVGYDNATKSIAVTPGQAYEATGAEMKTPFSGDRMFTGKDQAILVNGTEANERATMFVITLLDDQGGGYNYFKLRDLGAALGFNVDWSAERGVFIETDKPYAG